MTSSKPVVNNGTAVTRWASGLLEAEWVHGERPGRQGLSLHPGRIEGVPEWHQHGRAFFEMPPRLPFSVTHPCDSLLLLLFLASVGIPCPVMYFSIFPLWSSLVTNLDFSAVLSVILSISVLVDGSCSSWLPDTCISLVDIKELDLEKAHKPQHPSLAKSMDND